MLKTLVVIAIGFLPSLFSLWLMRRNKARTHALLRRAAVTGYPRSRSQNYNHRTNYPAQLGSGEGKAKTAPMANATIWKEWVILSVTLPVNTTLVQVISDVPLIQVAPAMVAVFMKKERKRLGQNTMLEISLNIFPPNIPLFPVASSLFPLPYVQLFGISIPI